MPTATGFTAINTKPIPPVCLKRPQNDDGEADGDEHTRLRYKSPTDEPEPMATKPSVTAPIANADRLASEAYEAAMASYVPSTVDPSTGAVPSNAVDIESMERLAATVFPHAGSARDRIVHVRDTPTGTESMVRIAAEDLAIKPEYERRRHELRSLEETTAGLPKDPFFDREDDDGLSPQDPSWKPKAISRRERIRDLEHQVGKLSVDSQRSDERCRRLEA